MMIIMMIMIMIMILIMIRSEIIIIIIIMAQKEYNRTHDNVARAIYWDMAGKCAFDHIYMYFAQYKY